MAVLKKLNKLILALSTSKILYIYNIYNWKEWYFVQDFNCYLNINDLNLHRIRKMN